MSDTHTPGPWFYASGMIWKKTPEGLIEHPEYVTLLGENWDTPHYPIARCDRETPYTSPCERDANARLIATAPTLLEALIGMVNSFAGFDGDEAYGPAIDAIAQATGQ